MFPEGKFDVIIQLNQKVETRGYKDQVWKSRPNTFIGGLHKESYYIKAKKDTIILGIQFKFGAARHFIHADLTDYRDNIVDLELTGFDHDDLSDLNCKTEDHELIKSAEEFLVKQFNYKPDEQIDKSLGLLINKSYSYTVKEVAKAVGLSDSRFRQRFSETIGISPKNYQKIIRFNRILEYGKSNMNSDLLDLVIQGNYYDQSHLIKDFKAITGSTPTNIL